MTDKFKYNAKEEDKETGLLHYGWREYDSWNGRFNRSDRFDFKYPSYSPYSYCINNPVNFVDVGGDSLWINYDNNNYLYQNGKLYLNGKEHTDKPKGFLSDALTALNKISEGKKGKEMVDALADSKETNTTITQTNGENKFSVDFKSGKGNISWNPSDTQGGPDIWGSTNRSPFIGLAHEVAHIFDAQDGNMDMGIWFTVGEGKDKKEIKNFELDACKKENEVRDEHNKPARKYYTGKKGLIP